MNSHFGSKIEDVRIGYWRRGRRVSRNIPPSDFDGRSTGIETVLSQGKQTGGDGSSIQTVSNFRTGEQIRYCLRVRTTFACDNGQSSRSLMLWNLTHDSRIEWLWMIIEYFGNWIINVIFIEIISWSGEKYSKIKKCKYLRKLKYLGIKMQFISIRAFSEMYAYFLT